MQYTQQDILLFNAFIVVAQSQKTPYKITMTAIAKQLGISRQSLNKRGYRNLDEIIFHLHRYIDQDVQGQLKHFNNDSVPNLIDFIAENILPILYRHRHYLNVLYNGISDPTWLTFIEHNYSPLLTKHVEKLSKNVGLSTEFITKVLTRQILSLVAVWMSEEVPDNPVVFIPKFKQLVKSQMSNLLQ